EQGATVRVPLPLRFDRRRGSNLAQPSAPVRPAPFPAVGADLKTIWKPICSIKSLNPKELRSPTASQEQHRAEAPPPRPDRRPVAAPPNLDPPCQTRWPAARGRSARSPQHPVLQGPDRLPVGLPAPRPAPQEHRPRLLRRLATGRHLAGAPR